ncbi:sugar-transfer associated ATP-grasp domain-containing protein [Psychrobacter namhaensis]|uniref:sugar-transfer associated ATP-grasp domain-containing protein n=1 Tax=Psychrobacter namhaensis TaxID=292734 RepID=UPI003D070EE2
MLIKSIVKKSLIKAWKYSSTHYGYYKRHKSIINNTDFNKVVLSSKEKKEYIEYWKLVSPNVSCKTVEISKSLSGVFNKYIVPEEFFTLYFEPRLNKDESISFLQNKSIYNKWFGSRVFPKDYFHKIDGNYYTKNFKVIDNIEEYIEEHIDESELPVVIKPNRDSYGGENIYFVETKELIKEILIQHSDLVVQEKIKQSELINIFNPSSINTVRVCVYKDNSGNIFILNTSIRMGKDGSLDNETAGGIVCNIKKNGLLNSYAVDKYANKYTEHPNSKYIFKDKEFPYYKDLAEVSKEICASIIGARLISLDMALDNSNNWRCIEVNLFGQTIRFAQYAGEPFFGVLTDEVKKLIIESQIEK